MLRPLTRNASDEFITGRRLVIRFRILELVESIVQLDDATVARYLTRLTL